MIKGQGIVKLGQNFFQNFEISENDDFFTQNYPEALSF